MLIIDILLWINKITFWCLTNIGECRDYVVNIFRSITIYLCIWHMSTIVQWYKERNCWHKANHYHI